MVEVADLKKYLVIDKDALDEALVTQADIFYRISEQYSLAISRRDEAAEILKSVDADTGLTIREEAAGEGRKITEGLVASAVQNSREHKEATDYYFACKKEVDDWGNLRESFSQRAHALRELVQLYVSGYYAVSSVSGASTQATEDEHEKYLEARRAGKRKASS